MEGPGTSAEETISSVNLEPNIQSSCQENDGLRVEVGVDKGLVGEDKPITWDYVDGSANPKNPKYRIRLRASPWRSVKNFDKEMSGEDAVTKCMESKVPVELEAINDVVSLLNKVSFDDNLECKEDDSGGSVSEACPKDNVHDVNRRTHVSSHPGSFDDDFNKNPIVLISGVTEIFQNHDEGSKQQRKIGIKLLGILEVLSLWIKSQCTWVIKEVARMIPTTRSRWR
ncbi:unnamed protein product [Amaranthus hypochondriacus]